MRYIFTFVFGLALLLQGCAVGPDYHRPAVSGTDGGWSGGTSPDTAAADVSPWQSLGDPVLTQLIETAVAHNLDLREAEANLRAARAQRDAAAGRKLPE